MQKRASAVMIFFQLNVVKRGLCRLCRLKVNKPVKQSAHCFGDLFCQMWTDDTNELRLAC